MDATVKALEDAAFHAWVTFGDLLVNKDAVSRAELEAGHAALQQALEAFRAARKKEPPC